MNKIYLLIDLILIKIKQIKRMEINDLRVEKFNKIVHIDQVDNYSIFNSICLSQNYDYAKGFISFRGTNKYYHNNQVYLTTSKPRQLLNQTIYLKQCPKILFLMSQNESFIIEQKINTNLNKYLIDRQQSLSLPFLKQSEAKTIINQLNSSANDYFLNKLHYDCLSTRNVVYSENDKWQLSVLGFIFGVDKNNSDFYPSKLQPYKHLVYSMAALFFKLLFGFPPVVRDHSTIQLHPDKYINILKNEERQKMLKIYHYCERFPQITNECIKHIEEGLSGKISWDDWIKNPYFQIQSGSVIQNNQQNKQILMIKSAKPQFCSAIIAAIDYKKNHPLERMNKLQVQTDNIPLKQKLDYFQKHPKYNEIQISQSLLTESSVKVQLKQLSTIIPESYFYRDEFDSENDYPCRDLINLIKQERENHPQRFSSEQYENRIKLYAFPYSIAFELLKVEREQTAQVKKVIKITTDLLLQVSALNEIGSIKKLHQTQIKVKSFNEIKQTYRANINYLYQAFLDEAMKKYNVKSDLSTKEKQKKKLKGLQYYKLCLKLLEASLIVRKGGSDLSLERIQTSQRKQIEEDISSLLQKYFPKKPEIH